MKKVLYALGIGGLIVGLSLYFKKQLDLALSYDYKIANWKILNLTDQEAAVEVTIELENKSAFEVEIEEYDISIFYKDIKIARAFSTDKVKIVANSVVPIKFIGTIEYSEAKPAAFPLIKNILQQKPIEVAALGFVKVKFLGLNHTIKFNKDKFQYSADLLQEYGLSDSWQKLKEKFKFLKNI